MPKSVAPNSYKKCLDAMNTEKPKPIPSMVRKQIFQEANSQCALCENSDVAALEIHHIDARKNKGSDQPENLILMCANCHRKATHGFLSRDEVSAAKRALQSAAKAVAGGRPRAGNFVHIEGNVDGSIIANTVRLNAKRLPRPNYPAGCIGADLPKKNYIGYLISRYQEFKKADSSFGADDRLKNFSYAVLYKNIEREFKAKTFYIPVHRFPELVSYLQGCIDRTRLGKTNTSRNGPNYEQYDEYLRTQKFEEIDS